MVVAAKAYLEKLRAGAEESEEEIEDVIRKKLDRENVRVNSAGTTP